jgi:hypothetical protein
MALPTMRYRVRFAGREIYKPLRRVAIMDETSQDIPPLNWALS